MYVAVHRKPQSPNLGTKELSEAGKGEEDESYKN